MESITVHVQITGKVQGVFFRDYTCKEATRLGLKGYVRNMPDRSVEAIFQGTDDVINKMVSWFHKGSPLSQVTNVTTKTITIDKQYYKFSINYL